MVVTVPQGVHSRCDQCAVYKAFTFSERLLGDMTVEVHQSKNSFHAYIRGCSQAVVVFEVACELKNGCSTEWLKECIDSFFKNILLEGFELQKRPDNGIPLAVPFAHALTRKADISSHDVSQFFHLPIKDAARELGMSTTYLKRICRQRGIPRWPYRKVASLGFDKHT
nr:minus dominance protein [Volvox rousseletii]BDG66345.1 minus dominance protein [Volvox rousseletii]